MVVSLKNRESVVFPLVCFSLLSVYKIVSVFVLLRSLLFSFSVSWWFFVGVGVFSVKSTVFLFCLFTCSLPLNCLAKSVNKMALFWCPFLFTLLYFFSKLPFLKPKTCLLGWSDAWVGLLCRCVCKQKSV